MLEIKYTNKYLKDLKRVRKQKQVTENEYTVVIEMLQNNIKLPDGYDDHNLRRSKKYKGCRECYIRPDLLLVYKLNKNASILELTRTGSPGELFEEYTKTMSKTIDGEQLIKDVTTEHNMNVAEVSKIRNLLTNNNFKESQKLNGVSFDYTHSDNSLIVRAQFYIDTTSFDWQSYVSTHTVLQADDYVNEGNIKNAFDSAIELLDEVNTASALLK